MNPFLKAFSVLLLIGPGSIASFAQDAPGLQPLLARAESEIRQNRTQAAIDTLLAAEKLQPASVAVLVGLSRQYGQLLEDSPPEAAGRQFAQKSLDYAKRAVALDAKNAKARLGLASAFGHMTDYVGNKQKLEYSRLLHEETLKALEFDPAEDGAWHMLGRWNFGIATVNPVLKTMAGLVYGGMPKASTEDAIRFLKKARDLAPRRIMHRSELARIYTELGKKDLAAAEWKVVLTLPPVDKGDEKDKREAAAALKTAP